MIKQKHFYLIRGLVREAGHWGSFPEELLAAFPHSHVSTIDLPGAGRWHREYSPLSVEGMVEQMHRTFIELRNENEEAIVIGISLGAMVATAWIQKHPEDFQHAYLLNSSFGRISPIHHRLKLKAAFNLLKASLIKDPHKRESKILNVILNHPQDFDRHLETATKIATERPIKFINAIRQITAASLFNVGEYLCPIPVTILASTHDQMVNVECSRAIARLWNAKIYEHPTAGHELVDDDSKWVIDKLQLTLRK